MIFIISFVGWMALTVNPVNARTAITNGNCAGAQIDTSFANGADIGWLSQMESDGYVFYNGEGIQKDCMEILKELGINSLRFRVWFDPRNRWCGKNDVATMAKRADQMGFRIMIDFHYSDSWADPGKQTKPSAWSGHTFDELLDDITNHTTDVLDTLKSLGITPEWVQIGNETNNGMLWPDGRASTNMNHYAKMVKSGYDAIKAVDSTIQAIVQLSNGHDTSMYRWMFDGLKNNGAKWDIVGMSVYPEWAHLNWETDVQLSVANMKDLITRYNTKVMVCETGYAYNEPYTANHFLFDLIEKTKSAGGLGVFYWEPESYNMGYNMGAWDPATKKPTLAMDAFLGIKHSEPSGMGSIEKNIPNETVELFPNPLSNEGLTVQINDPAGPARVRIYSITGQKLREQVTSQNSIVFSDLRLPPGVYFIQISNPHIKVVRKLIVK
jgi:arabinogalactan endo-1,4-beta-galactosidase